MVRQSAPSAIVRLVVATLLGAGCGVARADRDLDAVDAELEFRISDVTVTTT